MSTQKLIREFRRKAKLAGYSVDLIDTSAAGHIAVVMLHGDLRQKLTLPSSPASPEHSIKYALDEIRRFRTAYAPPTKHELHLHGPGGPEEVGAQTEDQPPRDQAEGHAQRRPARRRRSVA